MTPEGFISRLNAGRPVNCVYRNGELAGLISAWLHDGRFILTWEECRAGNELNENAYTRDERHEFGSAADVLAFVERNGHPAAAFGP